jgi:hypothetical protein
VVGHFYDYQNDMPPTIKQKKAFKEIAEKGRTSVSAIMRDVGYSEATAVDPGKLTKSKGWQELMEKHLSDKKLTALHDKILNKKEKIVVGVGKGFSEIVDTGQPHPDALRALDVAYKLKRKYPSEKVEGNNTVNYIFISKEIAEKRRINVTNTEPAKDNN